MSQMQRTVLDKTQHSHDTDIHVIGEIRTRNPSKRAVADPRLKLRRFPDLGVLNIDNLSQTDSPVINK